MKPSRFFLLMFIIAALQSQAQTKRRNVYDDALARKLGADDYGMKQYVMAFLLKGMATVKDSAEREELQKAHLKNIFRLADEGKLLVAGPFLDEGPIRGIFILNVRTIREAQELVATDPAIKAGTLNMELHPWYGSAAIMEVSRIHKTLEKKSVAE